MKRIRRKNLPFGRGYGAHCSLQPRLPIATMVEEVAATAGASLLLNITGTIS
jgi:hypothetical protein